MADGPLARLFWRVIDDLDQMRYFEDEARGTIPCGPGREAAIDPQAGRAFTRDAGARSW